MLSGVIILQDGSAQVIGEVDFERLAPVVEQIAIQCKQSAEIQRQQRIAQILSNVDPAQLQAALEQRKE